MVKRKDFTLKYKLNIEQGIIRNFSGEQTLIITRNEKLDNELDLSYDDLSICFGKFKGTDRFIVIGVSENVTELGIEIYDLEKNHIYKAIIVNDIAKIIADLDLHNAQTDNRQFTLNSNLDIVKFQFIEDEIDKGIVEFYNKILNQKETNSKIINSFQTMQSAQEYPHYYLEIIRELDYLKELIFINVVYNFLNQNKLYNIRKLTNDKKLIKIVESLNPDKYIVLFKYLKSKLDLTYSIYYTIFDNIKEFSVFESNPDCLGKYLIIYNESNYFDNEITN